MKTKVVDSAAFDKAYDIDKTRIVEAGVQIDKLVDKRLGVLSLSHVVVFVVSMSCAFGLKGNPGIDYLFGTLILFSVGSFVLSTIDDSYTKIAKFIARLGRKRRRHRLIKNSNTKCLIGVSDRDITAYEAEYTETVEERQNGRFQANLCAQIKAHKPSTGWQHHSFLKKNILIDKNKADWRDELVNEKNQLKAQVQKQIDELYDCLQTQRNKESEVKMDKEEILHLLKVA